MPEMRNVITVTALNRYVRKLLNADPVLTDIRLRGEISNFVHHRSGHFYFSLKDDACSVKAVMFRGDAQQLNFEPQNGMCVVADCRVSLFERDGSFQVYVEHLFPDGLGSIRMAFEQLKNRLAAEGLFEEEHKQPLPGFPATVGVITSATGAALQDIRNILSRRCPLVRLLLVPVTVQGTQAAPEIAEAIDRLDASGLADVIIVARGGGSAEDLWVFNDERIARAAYRCRTPLISAVGHEIDFTILDFAADRRAPTPSAAAELAVPDRRELLSYLQDCRESSAYLLRQRIKACRQQLQQAADAPQLRMADKAVLERQAALTQLRQTLLRDLEQRKDTCTRRMENCVRLAASLDPYQVLARGYAMIRREDRLVRPEQVCPGDHLLLEGACSRVKCTVDAVCTAEKVEK